jgi:hypothetical protein
MSFLTIIDPRTRIGPIVIDLSESEEHRIDITITDQVVEGALQVTDHAIVRPRPLRIEGRILTFQQWRPINIPGFANRQYKKLKEAARLRLPLIVQTRLETYTSMLIESVQARPEPTDFNTLRVAIEMREVLFSIGSTIDAAPSAFDLADGGVDLGASGGTAIP